MSERRPSSYREAGVDLEAASATLDLFGDAVRATYDRRVLAGIGAFGGLYALEDAADTVLVASTDSVGTKTRLATATERYRGVGADLVNHCIDDILVQGGRPLFFLDYVAAARVEPPVIAELVRGVADACRAVPMPLLGGETAELPGVYQTGEFDLVGTIVGRVPRSQLVTGAELRPGDRVLALASGGLQTNGFSLAQQVLAGALDEPFGDGTVADALLAPHRSFLPAVLPLLETGLVRGMAHITGGGIPGNLPRVLPDGIGAELDPGTWHEPAIFGLIRERGGVTEDEMRRVFNLGVGFTVLCAPERVAEAQRLCPEPLFEIGRLVPGSGVRFA